MSAANSRTGRPRPQEPGGPVYEELQPRFELEDNASSLVLNVFHPGFVEEQLTVTYNELMRSLNVRGERAIGPGKFVRFNKDIRIPDNARFDEMRVRFQSETLIVTVPKQTVISPPPFPLPPQALKPDQIASALPKDDDILNNKAHERDGPGKVPPTVKKVDDRMEKERPSTLIPPTPLAPLPNPAPKPVPTPAPWTKVLKENEGNEDSVKLSPLKEMKVGMAEEKKLMVNVVMAAIVLLLLCLHMLLHISHVKLNIN